MKAQRALYVSATAIVVEIVQSIYVKKWPNPKQTATVMKHTKSCEILCSITYSKSAKIKLLELTVFSERELTFTFAICHRRSVCLSVVCLSVCNVRAPYSGY